MGLFSFLRRDRSAANERTPRGRRVGDLPSADIVRAQARRRLIGAAVLVVIAVLVLPLVFDSKPRPLPIDIPIDLPKRDLAVALPEPPPPRADTPGPAPAEEPASEPVTAASAPGPATSPVVAAPALPLSGPKPAETAKPAPKPETVKPEAPKPEPRKTSEVRKEPKPEPKPTPKPEPKPEPKPAKAAPGDAGRAQAALEGREPASSTRFVVQVGAFEQAEGAREARQRVAKVGLQAHESVVQTADGKRIRVRLGPFASRDEADKAAAKLRAAGLGGAVVPQ